MAIDTTSNQVVFDVDSAGNVNYAGSIGHFARTNGPARVKAFAADSTRPTVEDTGTAQLIAGTAAVRLDSTLAAAIDGPSGYRVFVTPNGDTNGLFVASKTPSGFIVRESRGGRSTVTFDYRIVATAVGKAGEHMAFVAQNAMGPVVPAAARHAAPAIAPVRLVPPRP